MQSYKLSPLFAIISYVALAILTSCSGASSGSNDSSNLPDFENVSASVGLFDLGSLGQTASWGEFNGDGFQDLIVANVDLDPPNVFLFRNNEDAEFSDVTLDSGISDTPLRSAAWADFDNDDLLDLVVGTIKSGDPPILYKNSGAGIFQDLSLDAGITKKGGTVGHAIWADYDIDGWVDLFQANETFVVTSFLYHNERDGTFKEVSQASGLGDFHITNSAVWFDFNNDGFPDLFLANRGLNTLFLNKGGGMFTDITDMAHVGGDPEWNSVAACVGDFNNDGSLDLYVVNISSTTSVRNALYRNNRNGTFTDVTEETQTGDVGDGRTCAWVDFDGDGRIDLFTTNHVNPSKLFRNLGKGKFVDVASQVGLGCPDFPDCLIDIFAATWGDYNNDGFMDVFLNGHIEKALMENSGTENNFLIMKLVGNGQTTNTSAIGTRVEVNTSKGVQIREVSGGRGCCEQDMLPVHFGVGNENEVDIQVQWTDADGEECNFPDVNVEGGPLFQVSQIGCRIEEF